jgi:sugar O-acyltransferase (sialic acid O-acetyltransferase NeuD family)
LVKVVGIGAGGHAKVVIDILNLMKGYELVGLLDLDQSLWETTVMGVSVLGDDSLLPQLQRDGVGLAFIGVGSAADTGPRKRIYQDATATGFKIVDAIHPNAVIALSAVIGDGATVMAGTIINPGAKLGNNVIINTGSVVEHDCTIGDHAHIATGARLAGTVSVGSGAHIGAGAVVRQSINIGERAIVGAGAVVVKDVEPDTTVVGVPAKTLNQGPDIHSTSSRVRL